MYPCSIPNGPKALCIFARTFLPSILQSRCPVVFLLVTGSAHRKGEKKSLIPNLFVLRCRPALYNSRSRTKILDGGYNCPMYRQNRLDRKKQGERNENITKIKSDGGEIRCISRSRASYQANERTRSTLSWQNFSRRP